MIQNDDEKIFEEAKNIIQSCRNEAAKRLIGQSDVIDAIIMAFIAGGHVLLEGAPGLAKTLAIKTFSEIAEKYIAETGDKTKIILASTASPYKFAADVCKSIGVDSESLEGEALIRKLSEATSTEIPAPLLRTLSLPVRFTKVVKKTEMADVVFEK